jgi:hypothetical protein
MGRVRVVATIDFTTDGEHTEEQMSDFFVGHLADVVTAAAHTYDTSSLDSVTVVPVTVP